MNTITLEQARDPNARAIWSNKLVYIYSREHAAYWRQGGLGYTNRISNGVGVFDFSQAWALTNHCGPEKGIEFEEVES